MNDWQPSASHEVLRKRAQMLTGIRAFFLSRDVLEVTTPALSRAGNTDPHIDSISGQSIHEASPRWLHTSPELAMKRLLASGLGDCYQICQVFRDGESGRNHNPEFTMLEWYRLGFSMDDLIEETNQLIETADSDNRLSRQRYTYQAVFEQYLGFDPFQVDESWLLQRLQTEGLWHQDQGVLSRDEALDLLFSLKIAPLFPEHQLTTISHYPASQASLAQLSPTDPTVALRFEIYWGSVELANGFQELTDPAEQAQRFALDNQQRQQLQRRTMPVDELFLQAMESGLPSCSGVALGIDRLLRMSLGLTHLDEVLAFPWDRA